MRLPNNLTAWIVFGAFIGGAVGIMYMAIEGLFIRYNRETTFCDLVAAADCTSDLRARDPDPTIQGTYRICEHVGNRSCTKQEQQAWIIEANERARAGIPSNAHVMMAFMLTGAIVGAALYSMKNGEQHRPTD